MRGWSHGALRPVNGRGPAHWLCARGKNASTISPSGTKRLGAGPTSWSCQPPAQQLSSGPACLSGVSHIQKPHASAGTLMRAKHRPVHGDSSAEAVPSQVLVTPEGWTTGSNKADTDSLCAGQQFSGPNSHGRQLLGGEVRETAGCLPGSACSLGGPHPSPRMTVTGNSGHWAPASAAEAHAVPLGPKAWVQANENPGAAASELMWCAQP